MGFFWRGGGGLTGQQGGAGTLLSRNEARLDAALACFSRIGIYFACQQALCLSVKSGTSKTTIGWLTCRHTAHESQVLGSANTVLLPLVAAAVLLVPAVAAAVPPSPDCCVEGLCHLCQVHTAEGGGVLQGSRQAHGNTYNTYTRGQQDTVLRCASCAEAAPPCASVERSIAPSRVQPDDGGPLDPNQITSKHPPSRLAATTHMRLLLAVHAAHNACCRARQGGYASSAPGC